MTDANTHVVRALCHVNSSNPHETRHARIQTQLARVCEKEGERGYGERVTAEGLGGMGLLERQRTHSIESTFCREHIL